MLVKTINLKEVIKELKEIKRILGKRDVIIFGSLVKGIAIEEESDIDVAIKGKLNDKQRDLIYEKFSKKIYEKHRALLILHEINEKEWEKFLERIGEYVIL